MGILSKFDLSVGRTLINPNEENPKGFFENKAVLELNKKIINSHNSSWDDYHFKLQEDDEAQLKTWINEAYDILIDEFSDSDVIAIKDPRICLLFPIWEQALLKFDAQIKIVIPYRHPAAVAASLETRNDFKTSKSMLLWSRYFFSLEKYSRNHQRLLLIYPNDFIDAPALLSKLENFLELPINESNKLSALEFYDKSLTRHTQDDDKETDNTPSFLTEFTSLIETEGLEDKEKIDALNAEFKTLLGFFSDKETISEKNNELARKSTQIRQRNELIRRLNSDIEQMEDLIAKKIESKNNDVSELEKSLSSYKKAIDDYSLRTSELVNTYLRDREKNAWLKGMFKYKKDKRLFHRINRLQYRVRKTLEEEISPEIPNEDIKKKPNKVSISRPEPLSRKQKKDYWREKISATNPELVLTIAFAVADTELTNGLQDYKLAKQLSAHFNNYGWNSLFLSRLEGEWYKLECSIDILITFSDMYDLSKLESNNSNLVKIAWAIDWHKQWARLAFFDQYLLICTSNPGLAKIIQSTGNNQYLQAPDQANDSGYKNFAESIKEEISNRLTKFTISLKLPARTWQGINNWGDFHFAELLKQQLENKGFHVFLHVQTEWYGRSSAECDINLVLRGLRRHIVNQNQINIMWNISHPDGVTNDEYEDYDHVFIASNYWAKKISETSKARVEPLLQCSDTARFHPPTESEKHGNQHQLLFVGNSRGLFRKILKDLLPTKYDLAIYGEHPIAEIPEKTLLGDYLPNEELYKYYGSADILLNDHWDDMKEKGFISNRIYDGLASGAFIISDKVEYMDDLENYIVTYESADELKKCVEYYLSHPEERDKIASQGPAFIENDYTFAKRAEIIMQTIFRLNKQKEG